MVPVQQAEWFAPDFSIAVASGDKRHKPRIGRRELTAEKECATDGLNTRQSLRGVIEVRRTSEKRKWRAPLPLSTDLVATRLIGREVQVRPE